MTVRYSKVWGGTLLAVGLVCVGVYVAGAAKAGHWGVALAGGACLAVGIGYLVRPYFTVEEDRIVVHAILGPAKRTFPYEPGGLALDGGRLYAGGGEGRRRIPVSRSLAARADWEAFLRHAGLSS